MPTWYKVSKKITSDFARARLWTAGGRTDGQQAGPIGSLGGTAVGRRSARRPDVPTPDVLSSDARRPDVPTPAQPTPDVRRPERLPADPDWL